MRKYSLLILIIIFIAIGEFIIIESEKEIATVQLNQRLTESKNSEIILWAVGDIMLNRGVEHMIETKGEGDFRFPFLKIADFSQEADILFGNLEGPISDKGEKAGSIYSFRAEPKAIEGLKYAGFDILSLANNHALDYQRVALEETIKILKEGNIDWVGAGFNKEEAFSVKIQEVKKNKIGFLAYTNLGSGFQKAIAEKTGIAWIEEKSFSKIEKDIREAKEKVDILIVSLHSGEEYQKEPTLFQKEFSKMAIESGADLMVGHHPHIVQEIEKYKSGWIVYSLGNFVFDQGFSEETMEGLLLEVAIENGIIKKVIPKEIKISNFFQPYLK